MGGVSVGDGGHGGKKSVDHEIPLVPFIDLLLCCVMFLLATAVWNKLARINANQQVPGQPNPDAEPPEDKVKLILQLKSSGYTLATSDGASETVPKSGEGYDDAGLLEKLRARRQIDPNRKDIIVAPEDGVLYSDIVKAMDIVVGEGFSQMSLSDGASML